MAKCLALYARVSSDGQSVHSQLDALRAYADRRGGAFIEYVDHAVSGRRSSRPALDSMLVALRRRELEVVVVVRLDRLARSLAHMAQLGDEFHALGVELVRWCTTRSGLETGQLERLPSDTNRGFASLPVAL